MINEFLRSDDPFNAFLNMNITRFICYSCPKLVKQTYLQLKFVEVSGKIEAMLG